jgi:hypothetical protein
VCDPDDGVEMVVDQVPLNFVPEVSDNTFEAPSTTQTTLETPLVSSVTVQVGVCQPTGTQPFAAGVQLVTLGFTVSTISVAIASCTRPVAIRKPRASRNKPRILRDFIIVASAKKGKEKFTFSRARSA